MKRIDRVICIFSIILLVFNCETLTQKSPSETVKSFIMAANAAEYSEARKFLTSSSSKNFDNIIVTAFGGFNNFCDDFTKDGSVDKVEIISEESRGEKSSVDYIIYYKTGEKDNDRCNLILEDGV